MGVGWACLGKAGLEIQLGLDLWTGLSCGYCGTGDAFVLGGACTCIVGHGKMGLVLDEGVPRP